MKKRFLIFIALLIVFGSCTTNSPRVGEANADEINFIQPHGDQIAKDLMVSLQTELQQAMQSGGIEEAIDVCNLKAIPLTDIVAKSTDMEVDIKRTTLRYRNELNAPDEYEQMALNYFQKIMDDAKSLPEFYIQKIENNQRTEFYYYKPLMINALCLKCHGTDEFVNSETLALIQKHYPEDKAMGYKEGDFRGLIRIKFPDFELD
jgi:hypothetical protein